MGAADFTRILEVLTAREIDFIVVGGVAAVLHGAPVTTFDLDVVHSRTNANIDKLLLALQDLGARYRSRPDLMPGKTHLSSPGHQLLSTSSSAPFMGRWTYLGRSRRDGTMRRFFRTPRCCGSGTPRFVCWIFKHLLL